MIYWPTIFNGFTVLPAHGASLFSKDNINYFHFLYIYIYSLYCESCGVFAAFKLLIQRTTVISIMQTNFVKRSCVSRAWPRSFSFRQVFDSKRTNSKLVIHYIKSKISPNQKNWRNVLYSKLIIFLHEL
jgi:hypothetical protein